MSFNLHIFTLLLIPLSVLCSADIAMTTLEFYPGGYNLTSSGFSVSVVDEMEYTLLSITEERLKNGVQALYGSRPDRVYLSHEAFNNTSKVVWKPTLSYLTATWLQLTNVSRTSEVMNTMFYQNNGTTNMIVGTSINPRVTNTFNHRWLDTGFSTQKFMAYSIVHRDVSSITYTNFRGRNRRSNFDSILNQNLNSVQIPPGDSLKAFLMKHRNRFLLTILYNVMLKGEVLAYWRDDGQYRTFDVNTILPLGGMLTSTTTLEFIDYELINETWE